MKVQRPLTRDRYRASYLPAGGDHTDPLAQLAKVYLFENGTTPDGSYTKIIYGPSGPEGKSRVVTVLDGEGGDYPSPSLSFPQEYALPLLQALQEYVDPATPDMTVLQAALDLERARVTQLIDYHLTRYDQRT